MFYLVNDNQQVLSKVYYSKDKGYCYDWLTVDNITNINSYRNKDAFPVKFMFLRQAKKYYNNLSSDNHIRIIRKHFKKVSEIKTEKK